MKLNVEQVRKKLHSNTLKQPNGCWEWTKTRLPSGYGLFRVLGEKYAHRVSFMIHHGPLIGKMHVLHKCDNPPCVNPQHLSAGTNEDNIRDMLSKGRGKKGKHYKTHCPQGHEYSLENTFVRKSGARTCLICKRSQDRINQRRRKYKEAQCHN